MYLQYLKLQACIIDELSFWSCLCMKKNVGNNNIACFFLIHHSTSINKEHGCLDDSVCICTIIFQCQDSSPWTCWITLNISLHQIQAQAWWHIFWPEKHNTIWWVQIKILYAISLGRMFTYSNANSRTESILGNHNRAAAAAEAATDCGAAWKSVPTLSWKWAEHIHWKTHTGNRFCCKHDSKHYQSICKQVVI